jgi:hypothetical protein
MAEAEQERMTWIENKQARGLKPTTEDVQWLLLQYHALIKRPEVPTSRRGRIFAWLLRNWS